MKKPLLTIAIPTWNRSEFLSINLEQLYKESIFIDLNLIEILISDNCSTDSTPSIINKIINKGLPITYYRNESNIGWGENFLQCLKKARGKYVLLLGDDDLIVDGGLKLIIDTLNTDFEYGSITLNCYGYSNDFNNEKPAIFNQKNVKFEVFEEYLIATCLINTLLSSTIINKEIINFGDFVPNSERNLSHLRYYLMASMNANVNYYIGKLIIAVKRDNSSCYKYTEIFVDELWNIYSNVLADYKNKRFINNIKLKFLLYFYPRDFLTIKKYILESNAEILNNFDKHFSNISFYKFFYRFLLKSHFSIKYLVFIFLTVFGKIKYGDGYKVVYMLYIKLKNIIKNEQ